MNGKGTYRLIHNQEIVESLSQALSQVLRPTPIQLEQSESDPIPDPLQTGFECVDTLSAEVHSLRKQLRETESAIAQAEREALEREKRRPIEEYIQKKWFPQPKPLELKYAPVSRPRGVWGANADFRNKGEK